MSLEPKDLELIERLIYKCSDEISLNLGRSFERLEERFDSAETRVYGRMAEIEEKIEDARQSATDSFDSIREDIREVVREQ